MTVSCTDADDLPRVPNAGEIIDHPHGPVQVMHNGVLVEEGCYYGVVLLLVLCNNKINIACGS